MTAPTTDVGALVARLRELATPERAKHGVPQDVAMIEAATALQAESAARIAAERERDAWKATAKQNLDLACRNEDRADREKARADGLERQRDRRLPPLVSGELEVTLEAMTSQVGSLRAALTACRQDTAKLIADAVAAEREACAQVADELADKHDSRDGDRIAAAIHARTTGGSDHGE